MLFTRCPDCQTTFRITTEALAKAHGQVRCGCCACVFDAREMLWEEPSGEQPETATPPHSSQWTEDELSRTDEFAVPTEQQLEDYSGGALELGELDEERADDATAGEQAQREEEIDEALRAGRAGIEQSPLTEAQTTPREAMDELPPAEIIDQIGPDYDAAAAHAAMPFARPGTDSTEHISAEQVDAGLGPAWGERAEHGSGSWSVRLRAAALRAASARLWSAGSVIALTVLGVQLVHHFRAELAGRAMVGPWLQGAYAQLGVDLAPRWDLAQYQIMDWVAAAEPNASGQGSLTITARIHNQGPRAQPYPSIHLELKDRWETAVGSRIFRPQEYLAARLPSAALMAPGDTAQARLEVVDPGPDAYGFELDVCVDAEAESLRCATDAVFQ